MDIGRLSINIGWNTWYCFGIGFEAYKVFELTDLAYGDDYESSAKVLRFDFLIFFINFTWWKKEKFVDYEFGS